MKHVKKLSNWFKVLIKSNSFIIAAIIAVFSFAIGGVFVGESNATIVAKAILESSVTTFILITLSGLILRKIFGSIWDILKNSASKDDLESLCVSVNCDIKEIKESIAEHAEKNTAQYIKMIEAVAAIKK